MKQHTRFLLVAGLLMMLTGCAQLLARRGPPAANDWTTEYVGRGPVRTTVHNASSSALFMKIHYPGVTAAQVRLPGNGSRDVFLAVGSYGMKMQLRYSDGSAEYYRGPDLDIPANTARISLTLMPSTSTNLESITSEEFNR